MLKRDRSPWWGPLALVCTLGTAVIIILARVMAKQYILLDMDDRTLDTVKGG